MNDEQYSTLQKRLDTIVIILLAQAGLSQKEIAKILGVSNKRIWEIFGDKFSKVQVTK